MGTLLRLVNIINQMAEVKDPAICHCMILGKIIYLSISDSVNAKRVSSFYLISLRGLNEEIHVKQQDTNELPVSISYYILIVSIYSPH